MTKVIDGLKTKLETLPIWDDDNYSVSFAQALDNALTNRDRLEFTNETSGFSATFLADSVLVIVQLSKDGIEREVSATRDLTVTMTMSQIASQIREFLQDAQPQTVEVSGLEEPV